MLAVQPPDQPAADVPGRARDENAWPLRAVTGAIAQFSRCRPWIRVPTRLHSSMSHPRRARRLSQRSMFSWSSVADPGASGRRRCVPMIVGLPILSASCRQSADEPRGMRTIWGVTGSLASLLLWVVFAFGFTAAGTGLAWACWLVARS